MTTGNAGEEKPETPKFEVIQFPKDKIVRRPFPKTDDPEAARAFVETCKLDFIKFVAMTIGHLVDHELEAHGIDTSGPNYERDIQMVYEAIVSLIKRTLDIDCDFQKMADDADLDEDLVGELILEPDDEDDDEDDDPPPRYA